MNKIVIVGVLLAAALAMVGCEKAENAGRKVARKAGSVVGKGTTEFFSGVGEGIRQARRLDEPAHRPLPRRGRTVI